MVETQNEKQERALLVGLVTAKQNLQKMQENLDELAFLAETAGAIPVEQVYQNLHLPDNRTYVGSGKLAEIKQMIRLKAIDVLIFDDEISPAQQRNIEKETKVKVLDRSMLILDIFAQRARTTQAKLQVELAQQQYLMPRLRGMWQHLDRVKGGIGMRGAGEKEIETDRRIVRNKISLLKNKLGTIDKQMATQRGNRGSLVRVSLVGYTNVGKSTLMNVISKSKVFSEDKLFATLDTTVRKVVVKNLPFLLSDTVGFIRKLPTQLIESFKSTLDEVKEADILLHIADISHPNFEEHIDSVNQILKEINCIGKPTIMVFNKIDMYKEIPWDENELIQKRNKKNYTLEEWKKTWISKKNEQSVFISALKKKNVIELQSIIYQNVRKIHVTRFPYNHFLYPEKIN